MLADLSLVGCYNRFAVKIEDVRKQAEKLYLFVIYLQISNA